MKKFYVLLIACAITSLGLGQSSSENYYLRLNAGIGTGTYHTDFYFNDNSSSGVDRGYDASVFGSVAQPTAIYSHIVDGSYSNVDFAIQSLHTSALTSDIVVALGINVAQGLQVTLSMSQSYLPTNIGVILEDNLTGVSTVLNNNDYIFTPDSNLHGIGRFYLRFSNGPTLSTPEIALNDLKIYTTSTPRALFVKGELNEKSTISLYDVQGRLVLSSALETASDSNQVDVSGLSSGVYVVKLNTLSQQKTQRVIIK